MFRRRILTGIITVVAIFATSSATAFASEQPDQDSEQVFTFMSAAEYSERFGAERMSEPVQPVPEGARVEPASFESRPAQPGPAWSQTIRWTFIDREGTDGVTREGNSEIGYAHYAARHNLFSDRPIAAAIQDTVPVQPPEGFRREYQSVLTNQIGTRIAVIRVIHWDNFVTNDGRYVAADGRPIGTISAFCENVPQNRCPNEVNQ